MSVRKSIYFGGDDVDCEAQSEPKKRRVEVTSASSAAEQGMPNRWSNPVFVDGFKFDFKVKNDKDRGTVPLIHNDGLSVFTVMGTVRSSNFTKDQFTYETKHAELKLIPSDETLQLFETMTQDAAQWLIDNKDKLSSDWQKKLKGFKPEKMNKWWFRTATREDLTPCIMSKRLFSSKFDIYQLTSKNPLQYERTAGKAAGDDAAWEGKNFIPRGQNRVLLKLMPMITSFGNKVGISCRFVGDILMLNTVEKSAVKKVDFSSI